MTGSRATDVSQKSTFASRSHPDRIPIGYPVPEICPRLAWLQRSQSQQIRDVTLSANESAVPFIPPATTQRTATRTAPQRSAALSASVCLHERAASSSQPTFALLSPAACSPSELTPSA
ncbi:hypothetical protein L1887_51732 [Cichorium endivia]|nr:hypothetical protein L1887_51732 [Cichorium endivia]